MGVALATPIFMVLLVSRYVYPDPSAGDVNWWLLIVAWLGGSVAFASGYAATRN
jgi:hypothetical protein